MNHENGSIKYIGNFKNSQLNGHGTYYSKTGNILYIGNFLNGKYNGEGVLYNYNGKPIYEETFSNNSRSGFGKFYKYVNNVQYLYYVGYFHYGLFSGSGILYYTNGNILYSGNFKTGVLMVLE